MRSMNVNTVQGATAEGLKSQNQLRGVRRLLGCCLTSNTPRGLCAHWASWRAVQEDWVLSPSLGGAVSWQCALWLGQ